MTKAEVKRRIQDIEFVQNGFGALSGHDVKVVNLRKLKKKYVADIILRDYCDNRIERYNTCEYPIKVVERDLTNLE